MKKVYPEKIVKNIVKKVWKKYTWKKSSENKKWKKVYLEKEVKQIVKKVYLEK